MCFIISSVVVFLTVTKITKLHYTFNANVNHIGEHFALTITVSLKCTAISMITAVAASQWESVL